MNGLMRRSHVVVMLLAVLPACDDRPTVPVPAERIPEVAQHHGETLAAVGPAEMSSIFVYDDDMADGSPESGFGGPHLHVAAGHLTEGGGYVADEVVIGELVPGFLMFRGRSVVAHACSGTATYADATWTIALGGGADCERWNGVFRPRPPWVDSWDDPRLHPAPAAPVAPPVLRLVVPPPTTPFSRALVGLDAIEPGDAPCAVTLRAPDAEITAGATPGEAALHHAGEGAGEAFEVVRGTSGELLPSAPQSAERYQALFVRTEHREPAVLDGSSFSGGVSRGRAFLVDMTEGRVVCVGDVSATNGDAMSAPSERSAAMWLTLQLLLAEKRAIALGLHAPRLTP